jgi:hypothetical protein
MLSGRQAHVPQKGLLVVDHSLHGRPNERLGRSHVMEPIGGFRASQRRILRYAGIDEWIRNRWAWDVLSSQLTYLLSPCGRVHTVVVVEKDDKTRQAWSLGRNARSQGML